MKRVFLASTAPTVSPKDSSEFVLAIITDEETEGEALLKAEDAARAIHARLINPHDGDSFYRVIETDKSPEQATKQTVAMIAGTLMSTGQFTDNQVSAAVERAKAIAKQAGL